MTCLGDTVGWAMEVVAQTRDAQKRTNKLQRSEYPEH